MKDYNGKLKADIIEDNKQLEEKISKIKPIPYGNRLFHCPECGNAVLLNNGQYMNRLSKNKKFYCSAGHDFTFSS